MSPNALYFGFLVCVAGLALGAIALLRLASGKSAWPRRSGMLQAARWDQQMWGRCGWALAAGVAAIGVTRWPLTGVAATMLVMVWPRVFGGNAVGRRQLESVEAIAAWTESLRDTSAAAAGLEQALPATVEAAHPVLRAPLRDLAARLSGRVPLGEALAAFADDVADPAADLVVAALTLNARQRAGGLGRILTSLAVASRAELEMRRKVELERRSLRRQAQRIAGSVAGFAALQAVFARDWLSPYSSVVGQVVLAVLMAVFAGAFVRMRSLAASRAEPRFLSSAGSVEQIATHRPGWSLGSQVVS